MLVLAISFSISVTSLWRSACPTHAFDIEASNPPVHVFHRRSLLLQNYNNTTESRIVVQLGAVSWSDWEPYRDQKQSCTRCLQPARGMILQKRDYDKHGTELRCFLKSSRRRFVCNAPRRACIHPYSHCIGSWAVVWHSLLINSIVGTCCTTGTGPCHVLSWFIQGRSLGRFLSGSLWLSIGGKPCPLALQKNTNTPLISVLLILAHIALAPCAHACDSLPCRQGWRRLQPRLLAETCWHKRIWNNPK